MARSRRTDDWGFPRWRPYGSGNAAVEVRLCDRHGCDKPGDRPAPKAPNRPERWYFCEAHAAEYNAGWDYFAGLTPKKPPPAKPANRPKRNFPRPRTGNGAAPATAPAAAPSLMPSRYWLRLRCRHECHQDRLARRRQVQPPRCRRRRSGGRATLPRRAGGVGSAGRRRRGTNRRGRGALIRLALALLLVATPVTAEEPRPRLRDTGLVVGPLVTGPLNAISDVPGVPVGQCRSSRATPSAPASPSSARTAAISFRTKSPAAFFRRQWLREIRGRPADRRIGRTSNRRSFLPTRSTSATAMEGR